MEGSEIVGETIIRINKESRRWEEEIWVGENQWNGAKKG